MKRILVSLSLTALMAAPVLAASAVQRGEALYMKVGCYQCHGTVGQGGVAGTRLGPDPMAWEAFAQFVHTTSDAMPAYREDVLPDEQLRDIYAYLRSIPHPPPVERIPLLRSFQVIKDAAP